MLLGSFGTFFLRQTASNVHVARARGRRHMPIECYWAGLELSFSTGRRQCARCPHTRAANRAFTERRRDKMRGAGKALLHAATRRAITKQLPLEGLCMQSSTCPRNHFCLETFFRRLSPSAREKKIQTESPKTNARPIQIILATVLPDSEAPSPGIQN